MGQRHAARHRLAHSAQRFLSGAVCGAHRRPFHVGDADSTFRAGAGHGCEVDAESTRPRPCRRHCVDSIRDRTCFGTGRRRIDCVAGTGTGCARCGVGTRGGFAAEVVRDAPRNTGIDLELDEGRTRRDRLAGPGAVTTHAAGDGGGDVHHRLRRLERDHRLIESDALALGDVPLDHIRLGEPFAEIGEPKDGDRHGAYRKPRPRSRGGIPGEAAPRTDETCSK